MCASRPPLSRASRAPVSRGSPPTLTRNSRLPLKEKKRILVVDDKTSDIELVKTCLEQASEYEVLGENNPKAAVAAAEKFKPHLILLDVRMPGLDGCELAACIQANLQLCNVPIVFLTSLVTKKEVESGSGLMGRYPLLAKPIILSDLVACVRLHLRG